MVSNKMFNPKLKIILANKLVNKIRTTKISDKLSGFLLRGLHFHIPIYNYILLLLLPKPYGIYSLIPLIIAALQYVFLSGCTLTIAEQILLKDNLTIIDPLILLCNDKINGLNRYYYTLYLSLFYFVIVIFTLIIQGYITLS